MASWLEDATKRSRSSKSSQRSSTSPSSTTTHHWRTRSHTLWGIART